MASEPGVENAREAPRRVVAHHEPDVVSELAKCSGLELGVLDDGSPERPRVRDDDPDFHRAQLCMQRYLLAAMIATRLAPLALVALLAASCGDNDKKSATPATTAAAATTTSTVSTGPSGTTPIPAKPSSKGNRLLLGKRDLYPLLAGNLSQYVPNQVTGKSVTIVQVVEPDGFWAGRNARERILVRLNLKGKSAPKLEVGRQADFIGHLVLAQANDSGQLGVKGKSGQAMLQNQGVYVIVSVGDLKLH
jgi:hypothetical protein